MNVKTKKTVFQSKTKKFELYAIDFFTEKFIDYILKNENLLKEKENKPTN